MESTFAPIPAVTEAIHPQLASLHPPVELDHTVREPTQAARQRGFDAIQDVAAGEM